MGSPAPWSASLAGTSTPMVLDANGEVVCRVTRHGGCEDTARLLAASPSLHDALVDLLAALEQLEVIDWPALAGEITAARAALDQTA